METHLTCIIINNTIGKLNFNAKYNFVFFQIWGEIRRGYVFMGLKKQQ